VPPLSDAQSVAGPSLAVSAATSPAFSAPSAALSPTAVTGRPVPSPDRPRGGARSSSSSSSSSPGSAATARRKKNVSMHAPDPAPEPADDLGASAVTVDGLFAAPDADAANTSCLDASPAAPPPAPAPAQKQPVLPRYTHRYACDHKHVGIGDRVQARREVHM